VAIMSVLDKRPRQNLQILSKLDPDVWKQVAAMRAQRGEIGDWPSWCFPPIEVARKVPSLVSLVLYLCSVDAEIRPSGGGDRRPAYPEPKQTKKGPRLFPPDRPTDWEVGYRLGASLRRAATERGAGGPTATHAARGPDRVCAV
jgi:hypothetical protein